MGLISKTYTFTAGQTIMAAEHNTNFDTLYNEFNGLISNANISPTAAIADTKLATLTTAGKVSGTAITSGDIAIASTAVTSTALTIQADSLTTGCIANFASNSAQTNNRNLVTIINDNSLATGTVCCQIQQDSNRQALYVNAVGNTTNNAILVAADALTSGSALYISSNSADTSSRSILKIVNDHASSSGTSCINVQQDSVGTAVYIACTSANTDTRYVTEINQSNASATGAVCLKLDQAGAGPQIVGQGNENLSNAGVWTDRTCTYADKTDISPLEITGFIDKLKNLNLFNYKKKCEVANRQNPPSYKGFILDDPSTPEELVSRNDKGEYDGINNALGVNFLLACVKELIARVEALES